MTINDGITDDEQYAAACRYQNGFLGRVDPITAFMAGSEWARAYLAERGSACGEDPSGPLRPLTTDERSYRYAQDLGYELPEDPR